MSGERAARLVERFVTEVLVGEDHDVLEELFVTSIEEPRPTIGGRLAESVGDVRASYEQFHEHVSITDVDIITVHASETEALAVWTGKTEYLDSFRGIHSAGKPKRHQELTWIEVESGRIERVHHLRDTMETVPPAVRVAHTAALSTLETGVVVVDKDGDVVHVNPVALEIIDGDLDDVLGTSVGELLGQSVALLYPGESTELSVDNGRRVFEVVASPLRDERYDLTVGRFLLLHDITERKRRIQRLQVLNRVLRHNLRNDLTAIVGSVEHVRETLSELPTQVVEMLDTVIELCEKLVDRSEKARTVETALGPERRAIDDRDLATMARRAVTGAREEYPGATVDYEGPEEAPVEAAGALEAGLSALVENALEHNDAADPRVAVTVEWGEDAAVVRVADNGPGIPEHELSVLESGEETQLEHGSGLGLWLARWAVESSGGTLGFAENEPRGTVAIVEVPAADDG